MKWLTSVFAHNDLEPSYFDIFSSSAIVVPTSFSTERLIAVYRLWQSAAFRSYSCPDHTFTKLARTLLSIGNAQPSLPHGRMYLELLLEFSRCSISKKKKKKKRIIYALAARFNYVASEISGASVF